MADKVKTSISITGIFERYNAAFGYSAMKIAPRVIQAINRIKGRSVFLPVYDNSRSDFSTLEFENTINGNIYQFGINEMEDGTSVLPFLKSKPVEMPYLAPPPMLSISREKHTVITPIDRSENDVIENFGNKSYQIRMQGIIVDTSEHQYPGHIMREIHNMFADKGTYKVSSEILNNLDIYELFFEGGFKIDFVEGYVDTVKYSVTARSVESAEFLIV